MKTIAVKKIKRANISDISILEKIGVATSHESQNCVGLMDPHIRPIYKDTRIAGSAVTVLTHPNDNWMIHVAIELCLPGDHARLRALLLCEIDQALGLRLIPALLRII